MLSGHLHLRGVIAESSALQIVFAALIEDPFDVARVDIDGDASGMTVHYRCVSVQPATAERVPVLARAEGSWSYDGQGWARVD